MSELTAEQLARALQDRLVEVMDRWNAAHPDERPMLKLPWDALDPVSRELYVERCREFRKRWAVVPRHTGGDFVDQLAPFCRALMELREKSAGVCRHVLAAQMGTELIVLGATYVGNALGLVDGRGPLGLADELLERLKALAATPPSSAAAGPGP